MIVLVFLLFIINGLEICESCNADEFKCSNGDCIDIDKSCDNFFDCGDATDEMNCTVLGTCAEGTRRCDGIGECELEELCNTSVPAFVASSLLGSASLESTSSSTFQIADASSSNPPSAIMLTTVLSETTQNIASLSSATTLQMETLYPSTELSSLFSNTMNPSSSVLPTTTMATTTVISNSTVMENSSFTIQSNSSETNYGTTSSIEDLSSTIITSSLVKELSISSTPNIIESSSVVETSQILPSSPSGMVEETNLAMFTSQIIESSYALSSNVVQTSIEMISSRDMDTSTQFLSNKVESLIEPSTNMMVTYSTMYTSRLSVVESSNVYAVSSYSSSTSIESSTSILSSSSIDSNSVLYSNIINSSSVSLSNVTETTSMTLTNIMDDPLSISSNVVGSTFSPSWATSSVMLTSVSIREVLSESLLPTTVTSALSDITIEPSSVFLTSDKIREWSSISTPNIIKSSGVLLTSIVDMSSVMPTSSVMDYSSSTNGIEPSFALSSDIGGTSTAWFTSELSTVTRESVTTSSIISTLESTTPSTTPKSGEIPIDVNNKDLVTLIAVMAGIVVIMIIVSLVGYKLMRRRRAVTLHRGNDGIDNDNQKPPLVYQNEFPHLDFVHARRSSIPRPQSYTRITHNDLARHEEIELRPDYTNGYSQNDVKFY